MKPSVRSAALCALLWTMVCEAVAPPVVSGPGNPPSPSGKSLQPIIEAVSLDGLKNRQRRFSGDLQRKSSLGQGIAPDTPGLPLVGELDGIWDTVDAYLTFPYFFPDPGFEAQILLRGFDVSTPVNGNQYRVEAWDRTVYWLDFDVADPAKVPRLLATLQLAENYQPQANDGFPEFLADPAVVTACAGADCSIEWVPYVFLREMGRDYSGYPGNAADASMYFVADSSGDAVAAVLDIYDANGNFERTGTLVEGDELEVFTIAYRMSEPGYVYTVSVMHPETLSIDLAIERRYYVPGVDFQDPDLVSDLDAGNRQIRLVLDAQRGTPVEFQFAGPFALGFTWGEVPEYIFANTFEPLMPVGSRLVKRRP